MGPMTLMRHPEAVTIHSLTVVSEPAVGLVNRRYRCSLLIPLGADSLRFSYSALEPLRILVECPDRGILMDGDISPTAAFEWRQRIVSLVSSVGVPLRLTLASSLPFGVDHLCFTEELQGPLFPVDINRCSLEEWAQAVDRLCQEVREAPLHD